MFLAYLRFSKVLCSPEPVKVTGFKGQVRLLRREPSLSCNLTRILALCLKNNVPRRDLKSDLGLRGSSKVSCSPEPVKVTGSRAKLLVVKKEQAVIYFFRLIELVFWPFA